MSWTPAGATAWGFNALPSDTSTCGQEELGIEPVVCGLLNQQKHDMTKSTKIWLDGILYTFLYVLLKNVHFLLAGHLTQNVDWKFLTVSGKILNIMFLILAAWI